jgi:hypothetical protein
VADDLLDPAVAGSIRVLLVSEVMGVATFGIAERCARGARDRHIWSVLHALEEQTRAAVFDCLGEDAARLVYSERLARAVGTTSGSGLSVLPRRLQMRSLILGTKPFLPHFRKLDAHFAAGPRGPFFAYVLAHEQAIAELGRRALAHDDNPTAPVEALLGAVPS